MKPFPSLKLPSIVTQPILDKLAAPNETHEVHVVVRRVSNNAPYTLRGRLRQYLVQKDQARGSHILRVPMTVWMAGCPLNTVLQNDSICYDMTASRNNQKSPVTLEVWPIGGTAALSQSPLMDAGAHEGFIHILSMLNAPEVVAKAFHLAITGNSAALAHLTTELKTDLERQPLSAAERQKKRRERLKSEKEAAAKKQLQPA